MDDSYFRIIVFALGIILLVTLVLALVTLIKAISLINSIKEITKKAGSIASKLEHIGDLVQKSSASLITARFLNLVTDVLKKKSSKKSKGDEDE